jgi:hypothetical protein
MSEQRDIADREAGPQLDSGQRPLGAGKSWAILLGFAAVVFLAAASVNHKRDAPNSEPPAAATATQAAPGSTSAVAPQPAPATRSGG